MSSLPARRVVSYAALTPAQRALVDALLALKAARAAKAVAS